MGSIHSNPNNSFRAIAQTYSTVKISTLLCLEFAGSMQCWYCYCYCINIVANMYLYSALPWPPVEVLPALAISAAAMPNHVLLHHCFWPPVEMPLPLVTGVFPVYFFRIHAPMSRYTHMHCVAICYIYDYTHYTFIHLCTHIHIYIHHAFSYYLYSVLFVLVYENAHPPLTACG